MNLYSTPGYIIIRVPSIYGDAGLYVGQVVAGNDGKTALYHMGTTTRAFLIKDVTYHSVPLSNVLAFWDYCPDE